MSIDADDESSSVQSIDTVIDNLQVNRRIPLSIWDPERPRLFLSAGSLLTPRRKAVLEKILKDRDSKTVRLKKGSTILPRYGILDDHVLDLSEEEDLIQNPEKTRDRIRKRFSERPSLVGYYTEKNLADFGSSFDGVTTNIALNRISQLAQNIVQGMPAHLKQRARKELEPMMDPTRIKAYLRDMFVTGFQQGEPEPLINTEVIKHLRGDSVWHHSLCVAKWVGAVSVYLNQVYFIGNRMSDSYKQIDIGKAMIDAMVHDIGKTMVPEEALYCPRRFDKEGTDKGLWEMVKKHPLHGKVLLEQHRELIGEHAIDSAYQHHERHNETGYPAGLKIEDISPNVHIIRIADIFDALSFRKDYNGGKSMEYPLLVANFLKEIYTTNQCLGEFLERYQAVGIKFASNPGLVSQDPYYPYVYALLEISKLRDCIQPVRKLVNSSN